MKRCGPPMIDRRLKRKQTRHEVERAALEDQEVQPLLRDVHMLTFGSVSLDMFYQDKAGTEYFAARVMNRMPTEQLAKVLEFGGWLHQNGRMHLGYLVDRATRQPVKLVEVKPC